jgi:hypothetical protein
VAERGLFHLRRGRLIAVSSILRRSEERVSSLVLACLSPFSEAAHLVHAVKELFSGKGRIDRICYLLEAFRLKVRQLESKLDQFENEKEIIQAKVASPQFKEALFLAMDEASRTLNRPYLRHQPRTDPSVQLRLHKPLRAQSFFASVFLGSLLQAAAAQHGRRLCLYDLRHQKV